MRTELYSKKSAVFRLFACVLLFCLFATGCRRNDGPASIEVVQTFDFSDSYQGWSVDFADYMTGQDEIYEFAQAHTALPRPLDTTKKAVMVSSHNRSDDMFMFLKRKITGLRPNQRYGVRFEVTFASDAPSNWAGIGGAPGEGVTMKVGAVPQEPQKSLDNLNHYRLDIDKGNQSQGGKDAVVVGDVANGLDQPTYALLTRTNDQQPFEATTDGNGNLWVLVGTDSGFEGKTTLYYSNIRVSLRVL